MCKTTSIIKHYTKREEENGLSEMIILPTFVRLRAATYKTISTNNNSN